MKKKNYNIDASYIKRHYDNAYKDFTYEDVTYNWFMCNAAIINVINNFILSNVIVSIVVVLIKILFSSNIYGDHYENFRDLHYKTFLPWKLCGKLVCLPLLDTSSLA